MLILGGIATLKCIWSMHTAPAMISTSLYLHSVVIISFTSCLTFPYNTFFRYFGINTIWYWHFHRVCDMLLLSTWTTCYEVTFVKCKLQKSPQTFPFLNFNTGYRGRASDLTVPGLGHSVIRGLVTNRSMVRRESCCLLA